MAEQPSFMQPQNHQIQQIQLQSTTSQLAGQINTQEHPQQEMLQLQRVKEDSMHKYKNRLQEFAQRANLPLPAYHTVNEQEPRQCPKFRSSVEVDGETYTSTDSHSTRKAAEQDAARIALEGLSQKIKNCVSNKTADGGFPPIHEDRVFSKSILHEFAAKKNIAKPTYDTVRLDSVVSLFVSSVVFNGVKYTGEPGVNKKEAEQLAARAIIISNLANCGVDTTLSEIVKSKSKLFSAVREPYNVNSSISHLQNSGSDAGASAIKEIVSDSVQQTSDVIGNFMSEEPQQQSASKKARIPDNANDSCNVTASVVSMSHPLQSPSPVQHAFRMPNLETLPQPSLLKCSETLSQPTLVLNSQTLSHPNLQSQALPNPTPSSQTLPQPNLQSQTFPHPDLQSQPLPNPPPSSQTLPQPNLQSQTLPSQPPSSRTIFQPNVESQALPGLLPSSQTFSQSSLLPISQTLPQPNCLPITFIPSLETQTSTNETASSKKRKKKKANKKAKAGMLMQVSNLPLSQVPSCTTAQ